MEIVLLTSPAAVAEFSADLIGSFVQSNPYAVLGVATGSSPLGTYEILRQRVDGGELDFTNARAFALDEYVGIPITHPQSYARVINSELTVPLRMNPANVHVPNGRAGDLAAACEEYEREISEAGGVDVQLLGIGANGHIGFNEPTSSFASRTRVKTLAPSTIRDNARFFDAREDVPIHCLTQGLGTIMDARRIVLVAQGQAKAAAISAIVEGPVSSVWPGSILQHHPHATIVIDEAAGSALKLKEYYRHTFANKGE